MASLVRFESSGHPFNGANILDVFYDIEQVGPNWVLRHEEGTSKDFNIGDGRSAKTGVVDSYRGYVYQPPVGGAKVGCGSPENPCSYTSIVSVSFWDSLNMIHKLALAGVVFGALLILIFALKS